MSDTFRYFLTLDTLDRISATYVLRSDALSVVTAKIAREDFETQGKPLTITLILDEVTT